MPTVRVRVPKCCFPRPADWPTSATAGKVRYLGKHGSPESKEAYGRFLIEWEARRTGAPLPLPDLSEELTIVESCAAYLDYAEGCYLQAMPSQSQHSAAYRQTFVTGHLAMGTLPQENCKVVISPSLRRSASQRMVGRSASIGDVTCCNKVGSTSKDAERPMWSVPTRSTLQLSCPAVSAAGYVCRGQVK